jgi:ubiquitin-protein ligase E3 A
LAIEVRRAPAQLLQDVLKCFDGLTSSQLRRPLRVTFEGEEGAGPGVTKEFFQVALRSFLDGKHLSKLFRYNEEDRTYWFYEDANQRDAFRACGILLGQAVLNNVLVPNIFPRVLYEKLLCDLESPCARQCCMEDLAAVSKEMAQGLQRVIDYQGADIGDVFGDLDWAATGLPIDAKLTQETKDVFVTTYIEWFFSCRIHEQYAPLSEGFRAILGGSQLLQSMVDAVQLEKIVCGGSVPVDIPAIRRGAAQEGWAGDDELDYLAAFWTCVEGFSESERVQFVVFVTASDRVPLRGWQDLQLTVQKNGVGDDRLPTAHTCFCQLLLPRYSSHELLKTNLLLAIANSEGFGLR